MGAQKQDTQFRHLIEANADAMVVIDQLGRVRFMNPAAEKLFNLPAAVMLGQHFGFPVNRSTPTELDLLPDRRDPLVAEMRVSDINWEGESAMLASLRDITAHKKARTQLQYRASHDALTGLPNRPAFHDYLHQSLIRSRRHGRLVGILFLDLDGFKEVNDSHGHEAGDQLLRQVADRVRETLRKGDFLARLGGDEFTVCLEDIKSPEGAAKAADKVLQSLHKPFDLGLGRMVTISTSIGISIYPNNGRDAATLLQCADRAMYEAKKAGRDTARFFGNRLNMRVSLHGHMEEKLRRAIERQEFKMLFQPRLAPADGNRITAVEALLRWGDHTAGWRRTERFIKIAEYTGQIEELGGWALEQACRQAAWWAEKGYSLPVVVNLSLQQLNTPGITERLETALAQTGLPPASLRLEIPSSFLVWRKEKALSRLAELRRTGVELILDDFACGNLEVYTLLASGIRHLTLERNCLVGVPRNKTAISIIRGLLAMLRDLGQFTTVIKGVETAEQREFLLDIAPDLHLQGFHLAKPMDPGRLIALLTAGRNDNQD